MKNFLAQRQPEARLLFMPDNWQIGVEQVLGFVDVASAMQPHHIDKHFRECESRHRAIDPSLQLLRQIQTPIADQDGHTTHTLLNRRLPYLRYLAETGPIFMFEHYQLIKFIHKPIEHSNGRLGSSGQRVVLVANRHTIPQCGKHLAKIPIDLLVGAKPGYYGDAI